MLTESEIRKLGFESGLLRIAGTTFARWRDGIDIDYPVLAVEKFAHAVERAAYERAAQECLNTPDTSGVNDDGRAWLVRATRYDFAAAIRALAARD